VGSGEAGGGRRSMINAGKRRPMRPYATRRTVQYWMCSQRAAQFSLQTTESASLGGSNYRPILHKSTHLHVSAEV